MGQLFFQGVVLTLEFFVVVFELFEFLQEKVSILLLPLQVFLQFYLFLLLHFVYLQVGDGLLPQFLILVLESVDSGIVHLDLLLAL